MAQLQESQDAQPLALIVDDHPTIRTMMAHALHMNGFQPIEAANGREAISWMEQAARALLYPSLLLLDLAMPVLDGQAFLTWLQSSWVGRHPTPKIILLTASTLDEGLLTSFPIVTHIMPKPFHIRDLVAQCLAS
jgi:two-component system chemotaxis response regulator CheY